MTQIPVAGQPTSIKRPAMMKPVYMAVTPSMTVLTVVARARSPRTNVPARMKPIPMAEFVHADCSRRAPLFRTGPSCQLRMFEDYQRMRRRSETRPVRALSVTSKRPPPRRAW